MDTGWRIEMLGWLRAMRGDQLLTRFRSQQTGALLAYLAYHSGRPHPRDLLVELLWPGCDPESGRHRLRMALSSLRQQLEPRALWLGTPSATLIVADRSFIQLDPAAVSTDVAQFDAALEAAARAGSGAERAQRLTEAVDLYRGDLLPGFFDDWVLRERQWLAERYAQALSQLMEYLADAGDLDRALQYAHRAVRLDPLREEAHRDLMRLYAAAGQPAAALRQYRELERLLRQELAVAPDAATRALARDLGRLPSEGTGEDTLGAARARSAPSERLPQVIRSPGHQVINRTEAVGGAMPVDSPFYVVRPTDGEFCAAIARQDSIVLVKGARQMGKSSLLARGLHQARAAGTRVVLTDLQMFNASHFQNVETFLLALARSVAVALDLSVRPQELWDPGDGPNVNFEQYLRRVVLGKTEAPLVWGLDEIDRLFPCGFGSEVFGLLRSWHNRRSLDPTEPWSRLTLAMAYATEAHLFIADLNQSPFNVGTRLTLHDFTLDEVSDLNRRYVSPLKSEKEMARFFDLLNGQPYLVQRSLHEMAARSLTLLALEAQADQETGIFSDHLRRLLVLLTKEPDLREAVRAVLQDRPCPGIDSFYRLRSAGVLAGETARDARLRCRLYATYLARHLL